MSAEERTPAPVSKRALMSAVLALPALAAVAPSNIADLWARRDVINRAAAARGVEDEALDRLLDKLSEVENAIMRVPITSKEIALRRLQLAAHDAEFGERYGAPKSVAETIEEAIRWLGAH